MSWLDNITKFNLGVMNNAKKTFNNVVNSPIVDRASDMVYKAPADPNRQAVVTQSPKQGQPYGGYYNSRNNLINIVNYGKANNAKTLVHERAHEQLQRGREAFRPLASEQMFAPLSPDYRVMANTYRYDKPLYNDVNYLMKNDKAYAKGYDLPQEMYAYNATKQRDRARIIKNKYLSPAEE